MASVNDEVALNRYTGNGVTTVFPYQFTILDQIDIAVYVDGTLKTLSTHYTLTNVGVQGGGNVTILSAPANGSVVVIVRDMDLSRQTDYQANGAFLEATVDADFNRIWYALQQERDVLVSRALRAPLGEAPSELPAAASRVGQFLSFDSSGNPVMVAPTSGTAGALAANLIISNDAAKGAGQVGFDVATAYTGSTVGRWLRDIMRAGTSLGASLVGFIGALTGAVSRTMQDKGRDFVSLSDFLGAGTYTQAWQAAVASGAAKLYVDINGGSLTATIAIPANMQVWSDGAQVNKGFSGDMFTLASAARMEGLKLAGAGGTFTGRGIVVNAGSDQRIINCDASDMNGSCLDFTADSAGSRAYVLGGFWQRTTASNPAIKCGPAVLEAAGERKFVGLQAGGGVLFDTAGSQNTHIIACSMANMTFGAAALKTIVLGCRISTAGADFSITGQDHQITSCIISGNVVLAAGAVNVRVISPTIANTFNAVDNSGVANNFIDWQMDFTPVLGADTGSPALGNGTLTGRGMRAGNRVRVEIQLILGSTTNVGTTGLNFTLPGASIFNQNVKKTSAKGAVYAIDSGTGIRTGSCRVAGGAAPKIYCASDNQASVWGGTVPITWAVNDVIELEAEWEIG